MILRTHTCVLKSIPEIDPKIDSEINLKLVSEIDHNIVRRGLSQRMFLRSFGRMILGAFMISLTNSIAGGSSSKNVL